MSKLFINQVFFFYFYLSKVRKFVDFYETYNKKSCNVSCKLKSDDIFLFCLHVKLKHNCVKEACIILHK